MQLKTALRCFRIFILHISHHLRFYSDFAIISLCRWRTRGRGRDSERDSLRCLLFLLMHCISLLLPLLCSVGLVCCWCKSLFIFLILPFASRNTKSGRRIWVFLCVLLVALARSLLVVEVEAARERSACRLFGEMNVVCEEMEDGCVYVDRDVLCTLYYK